MERKLSQMHDVETYLHRFFAWLKIFRSYFVLQSKQPPQRLSRQATASPCLRKMLMTLIAIKTRMTHGPLRMQPPKPEVNVSYNFSRNVTKTSQMSLNRRNGDINRDRCHGIPEIVTVCPVSLWGPGTPESNHTCRLLLVPVAPCKNANVDWTVRFNFQHQACHRPSRYR